MMLEGEKGAGISVVFRRIYWESGIIRKMKDGLLEGRERWEKKLKKNM